MSYPILIQALAIIALVIWASSYHCKKRKIILLVQLASFIFWITHFLLIEAYTGAALATVAAIRLGLFSFKTKNNWIGKPIVMWSFIVILFVSTLLTFSAYWALFAFIGGTFAIIASWQNDNSRLRKFFIPSHIFWIIYDIFAGSWGGAISEFVLGVSAVLSILRKDLKN